MNAPSLARGVFVMVVIALGSLGFSQEARADYDFRWHYLLTQTGRNGEIVDEALSYDEGDWGGQCKEWVQWVVYDASWEVVWLPRNDPYCDWRWKSSSNVSVVATDNWDVRMKGGYIIQAQVKYRSAPYKGPHTMIVLEADDDYITVIDSNYYGDEEINIRRFSRSTFKSKVLHFTLYKVK